MVQAVSQIKGAEWLVKETNPVDMFIPEDFSEEQQMVLQQELLPVRGGC